MHIPLCFSADELQHSSAVLVLIGEQSIDAAREQLLASARAAGCSVRGVSRLSAPGDLCVSEAIALSAAPPTADAIGLEALRRQLQLIADQLCVDVSVRSAADFGCMPRLAVFDMDSTLIQAEVIDELARAAGCWSAVSAITERAMRGELDFVSSFRERMSALRGLDLAAVDAVAARIQLSPGAPALLATLRATGCRTAIVSGGFDVFARRLQTQLGVDEVHANHLHVLDGRLTGEVHGRVIDAQRKLELLHVLQQQLGLQTQTVLAVGDGANDLPMLGAAGMGLAYRAKPVVRAAAQHCINQGGLERLLFMLGIAREHWAVPAVTAMV